MTIGKLHLIGIIKHVILQLTTGNGQVKQSKNVKHAGQYNSIAITFFPSMADCSGKGSAKNTVCTM